MALFWRIFGTLVAVTALSLVVFVGLATGQYDAVLAGLMRDRISVIVRNIAEPLRAVVDLGLPINRMRDAEALLEPTRQSETEIVGIHLFDNHGNIVLSTAGGSSPALSAPALATVNVADGGIQHLDDANAFLVVSPVKAPDGSPGGGVLMEYSKAGKSLQVRALAAQLAFVAALILAATAGAGWIFRS